MQIPLQLSLPTRYGRADFLVSGSNEDAVRWVERWPDWPDPVLLLVGPPGSGKTHLGRIWCERAGARLLRPDMVEAVAGQAMPAPTLIDGADAGPWPEAALFHFLNLARQARVPLLITARLPPDRWGLRTPDLLSRLRLAPLVSIAPPDEALMRAVLAKLFDDRQVWVDSTLVDYLVSRLDRSLGAARMTVEALDSAGLSKGGRITRALAAEVLKTLDLDAD